jgi:hypothetical protein
MKKHLPIIAAMLLLIACKKDTKEFTKVIYTEGDVVLQIPYAEINADEIFKKKKIKTDYTTTMFWQNAGTWQAIDLNNFAGGSIALAINQSSGDLTIDMKFAPFGTDQGFKIVIKE